MFPSLHILVPPIVRGWNGKVCSVCDAPLAAAGLFVVSEALKTHPDLRWVTGLG